MPCPAPDPSRRDRHEVRLHRQPDAGRRAGHGAARCYAATAAGGLLFLSGQIGQVPEGMDRHTDGFDAAVKGAMDAVGTILKSNGLDYGDIVKCTVMLADMTDWPRFNAAYLPYFKGKRLPARSAFGANGLALGAPLEVECIAAQR